MEVTQLVLDKKYLKFAWVKNLSQFDFNSHPITTVRFGPTQNPINDMRYSYFRISLLFSFDLSITPSHNYSPHALAELANDFRFCNKNCFSHFWQLRWWQIPYARDIYSGQRRETLSVISPRFPTCPIEVRGKKVHRNRRETAQWIYLTSLMWRKICAASWFNNLTAVRKCRLALDIDKLSWRYAISNRLYFSLFVSFLSHRDTLICLFAGGIWICMKIVS